MVKPIWENNGKYSRMGGCSYHPWYLYLNAAPRYMFICDHWHLSEVSLPAFGPEFWDQHETWEIFWWSFGRSFGSLHRCLPPTYGTTSATHKEIFVVLTQCFLLAEEVRVYLSNSRCSTWDCEKKNLVLSHVSMGQFPKATIVKYFVWRIPPFCVSTFEQGATIGFRSPFP